MTRGMSRSRRHASRAGSHLVVATALTLFCAAATAQDGEQEPLTVVSWGGVYTESQEYAYYEPYTEETGVPIERVDYDGNFDDVIEQVESGEIDWQLVDVTLADAIRGCNGGYLEPIPPSILPPAPDGTPAMEDFLPNTLHECAVGLILWSTLFVYDIDQFPEDQRPDSIEHVFQPDEYPGERGFRRTPRNTLEYALMGSGVPPDEVYAVMATDEGIDRAFDALDGIRDSIRWWEDGATPQEWLANDEVSMTAAYNGRAFNRIVQEGENWDYIWDGQIWEIDLWVVPRGAPDLARILDFVAFSTSTRPLAEQTEVVSYAPARRSSLPLVRSEYQTHMPTAPGNFRNALQNNFEWWADNQERMDERFEAWLASEQ